MKLKRFTLSLASLASFSLLVACSQRAQQNTNTANAGGN